MRSCEEARAPLWRASAKRDLFKRSNLCVDIGLQLIAPMRTHADPTCTFGSTCIHACLHAFYHAMHTYIHACAHIAHTCACTDSRQQVFTSIWTGKGSHTYAHAWGVPASWAARDSETR